MQMAETSFFYDPAADVALVGLALEVMAGGAPFYVPAIFHVASTNIPDNYRYSPDKA